MREILFRGKRHCGKDWVDGYYNKVIWVASGTKEYFDTMHYIISPKGGDSYLVIPKTVGQFIGMTDKTKERFLKAILESMRNMEL